MLVSVRKFAAARGTSSREASATGLPYSPPRCDEAIEARFDRVGHLLQAGSAFADPQPAPLSSQGLSGRPHRVVDQALICLRDLGNHAAICGIDVDELPFPGTNCPSM